MTGERAWRSALPALAVGALAAAWLLPRLGARTLAAWDEAIYAQAAREMLERASFVTPWWNGEPFFEKPPLGLWLTLAAYAVVGVGELGARLGSALAGVALAVVTFRIGRRENGTLVGALAVLVLLASRLFVESARRGMLDVPLSLAVWLAFDAYADLRAGRRGAGWRIGAASAAAVMLKSLAGLLAPIVIALTLALDRPARKRLAPRELGVALAVFVALAAPWHLAMIVLHGAAFVDQYWGYHVVRRVLEPLEGHSGGAVFYLDPLRRTLAAWLWLAPAALLLELRRLRREPERSPLPVVALLVLALGLAAVQTRNLWYAVPAAPALALLVAAALGAALRDADRRSFWLLALCGLAAALAAPWPWRAPAAALVVTAGLLERWGGARRSAPVLLAALLAATAPTLRSIHVAFRGPVPALAAAVESANDRSPLLLDARGEEGETLAGYESTALFYARRSPRIARSDDEIAAALAAGARHALVPRRSLDDWRRFGAPEVVAESGGYLALRLRPGEEPER